MEMISVILPVKGEPALMSFLHDLHTALIGIGEEYEILIQREEGLGRALFAGMKKAKGDWVLTIDTDGQQRPEEIGWLWDCHNDYDFILGGKPRTGDSRSFFRRLVSKAYYRYMNRHAGGRITDMGSNFRFYKRWLIDEYLTETPPRGYRFLIWTLNQAALLNANMIQISTSFKPRLAGKSKMSYSREIKERLLRQ